MKLAFSSHLFLVTTSDVQYDSLYSQQRICLEPRLGLKRTDIINIRHEYLADSTRKLEDIDDAVSIRLSCERHDNELCTHWTSHS